MNNRGMRSDNRSTVGPLDQDHMISSNERKYDRLRLNGPCVLRTAYYIKSPYCVLRTEISSFAMTVPTDIAGQVIDSTNEDISSTQYAVGSGQYVFC